MAGIGSTMAAAIASPCSANTALTDSSSSRRATTVAPAIAAGTPAELASPVVANPDPAFTSRLS